jgi:hypothetical protein
LAVIILFVLLRGVLGKVGVQRGKHGFAIIMRLMTIAAGVATLSLLLTYSVKAYEIYWRQAGANASTIEQLRSAQLTVDYSLDEFTGATFLIGNRGQGVLLVSRLTLEWEYMICASYEQPRFGAPLVTYQYDVDLTKSNGSKLLDERDFKYGSGEVDRFRVRLNYPGYGIYKVWLVFEYRELGGQEIHTFHSEKLVRRVCEKS